MSVSVEPSKTSVNANGTFTARIVLHGEPNGQAPAAAQVTMSFLNSTCKEVVPNSDLNNGIATFTDSQCVVSYYGFEGQFDGEGLLTLATYTFSVGRKNGTLTLQEAVVAQENRDIAIPFVAETVTVQVIEAPGPSTEPDTSGMDLTSSTWDGISVDVSWYFGKEGRSSYTIRTAAQWAGVAALVNGLVNSDCKVYTGDAVYSASEWNKSSYVNYNVGTSGANNQSTDQYNYGITQFADTEIKLTADLDMRKGNYMPVGGQYLMTDEDTDTKIDASFCGKLNGQGHSVTLACDRHCDGNYGDGQSVGLIGRLGVHDNEAANAPSGAGVYDVAVYGSVSGNRSVGGVVGKIGKTSDTAVIRRCANYADINGTDAKGTGGICGAAWNNCEIRSCYNSGSVTNTSSFVTGGIAGSCEGTVENCYNVGKVTAASDRFAMAIGTNNGGASFVNCWYLEGSASGGWYSGGKIDTSSAMTSAAMKELAFVDTLGSDFKSDTGKVNQGYPVFGWQSSGNTGPGGIDDGDTPTTETEIKTTTEIKDKDADVTVDNDSLTDAAKKADENTQLVISGDFKNKEVDSVTIILPEKGAKETADSGASIKIKTPLGEILLPNRALKDMTSSSGDLSITIKKNADKSISVELAVGDKPVKTVKGGIKLKVPAEDGNVAALTDGTIISKSIVENGYAYVVLPGSETFHIITNIKLFEDVEESAWYKNAVDFVSSHILFNGVSETKFAPDGFMTRAMLVTVLHRLEGLPASSGINNFPDVMAGTWYTDAVIWANENQIVKGYGNGLFGPNDPVTREQMAAILYRYMKFLGLDTSARGTLSQFADGDTVSAWAVDEMQWAIGAGILKGKDGGLLDPGGTATRAEVATMLMRLVRLIVL